MNDPAASGGAPETPGIEASFGDYNPETHSNLPRKDGPAAPLLPFSLSPGEVSSLAAPGFCVT
jgi:hypothetical protein